MLYRLRILFLVFTTGLSAHCFSQIDTSLYGMLRWRMIGPFRGGRTVAAAGVPQQPNVFYMGVNNGGVWKTNDYGRTWLPVFDNESTGSIGAIAVAPSDSNIIYVGSGEGLQRPDLSVGNGIYKSTDAGKTWTHLGLRDGQQIPKIAIDPKNPNRIFVAVLGHPYGPNEERGIYRSTDGGKNFEKVLYSNENVGGDDVEIDPLNPNIVYATMWEARQGPWENGAWSGTHGGIYKSTDGGTTWKKIQKGLPENLVQAHIAVAPSSPNTVYVVFSTTQPNGYGTGSGMGLYRSDDGGENWKDVTEDGRPKAKIGGGDLPEIAVDPQNAEIIYSTSIVFWRSVDGGKTWTGIKGAPGGDDYQNIWINPLHPEVFLVTSDQGAAVSVNGGQTYSSWYNQPTAQLYHVSADNAFPYNVYSGQQESGSVGIASRGNDGGINFRDWHPVGAEEYGYVVADPLNSNIVYGGKISKYDKRTGQVQNIAPEAVRSGKYRFVRTEPVVFSPIDPHSLFFAGNVLFKTKDGGNNWQVISPDLTRESWDVPPSVGIYSTPELKAMPRRGVIYTVAPSYKDVNTIWCGTDDGYIQLTKDGGKSWKNVTPSEITSWNKISIIDAGHFDVNTAYAAVNKIRLDDMHPYIYKTHDGGKIWTKIVNGLPDDPINVVREDPVAKGLLFAGSERAVYVSFDDGEHWQPLRMNMPATSIRDLIIKDDDIVVATHGRGFWIMDHINPLRQFETNVIVQSGGKVLDTSLIYIDKWDYNTGNGADYPWGKYVKRPSPKFSELQDIKGKASTAEHAAFIINTTSKVGFEGNSLSNSILYGVTEEFPDMQPIQIQFGRFMTNEEFRLGSNAAVIGNDVAEKLFGTAERAVGKQVTANGKKVNVVGIIKKEGNSIIAGWEFDKSLVTSYRFGRTIMNEHRADPLILVKGKENVSCQVLKDELKGIMRSIHKLNPEQDDDFSLNSTDDFGDALKKITSSVIQYSILFKPSPTYRVRWNMNTDTPLPPEEPAGQNPPDGAVLDYYLSENVKEVVLQIKDAKANLVRQYSSNDTLYKIPEVDIPLYWIRPQQILSAQKGAHRFVWDLHYQPLNMQASFPMTAVIENTAPAYTSPWVMPGVYKISFLVDGQVRGTQDLLVKMDPRVKASAKDLWTQHDLSLQAYNNRKQIAQISNDVSILKATVKDSVVIDSLNKFISGARGSKEVSLSQMEGAFATLFNLLQESDMPPTTQMINSMKEAQANFQKLLQKWNEIKKKLK